MNTYLSPETYDCRETRNNNWIICIEQIHSQAGRKIPLKKIQQTHLC